MEGKWSNYPYANLQLGYSWTLMAAGGGLGIVGMLLLVGHGMCLCFAPRACCAAELDEDDLELPSYRRGGAAGEEYDSERWWVSQQRQRATGKHVTGSGIAGSAVSSASAGTYGSSTTTGTSKRGGPTPDAVRIFGDGT